jgi:hypothetical protein
MMITGIDTRGIARPTTARGRSAAGRFQVADAPADPAGVRAEAATTVSLGGLLAMQEEPRADDRNRRARAGGVAILAELAAMQRACLEDGDASAVAQRLDGLVASLPDAADPGLAGVVRLIALRARIEMLRAGRSRDAS